MRFLFFIAGFLLLNCGTRAQTNVPSAAEVLKPVYAKAAAENKNVLLIFHASWCGWCRKMDASLADPSVKPLMDRYYEIAHLTVHESPNKKSLENPGALELLNKNGGTDQGLPYWLVLNKDGTVLANSLYKPGENTGCPASAEEVAHFINVLRKTSKLGAEALTVIGERFRKNEN